MHANFKNVQGIKKHVNKYMIFQNYFREDSSKCSQTLCTRQASSSNPRHQPSYCGPWGCSGVRPSRHTGGLYLSLPKPQLPHLQGSWLSHIPVSLPPLPEMSLTPRLSSQISPLPETLLDAPSLFP